VKIQNNKLAIFQGKDGAIKLKITQNQDTFSCFYLPDGNTYQTKSIN
jgi:hypothetical protein